MEIGTHCKYSYCKQRDFLPFNCSGCKQSFCIEHRTHTAHECSFAQVSKKAIICPVCTKTIFYSSTVSENEIWEIHSATECDQKYKEPQIVRCIAPGCRNQLRELNTHQCKSCNQKVCMKHRFPESHQCGSSREPVQSIPNNTYNFNNPYNQQHLTTSWK